MNSSEEVFSTDVIIVGGGLSGLSAAYELHQKNDGKLKLAVLEAKERIGGRLVNAKLPAASGQDYWDLGGQWVSSSQKQVMGLLSEMKMNVFKQYTDDKNLVYLDHPASVYEYQGLIPPIGWINLINYLFVDKKISRLLEEVSTDKISRSKTFLDLDSMTLQTFADQNSYFSDISSLLACMTRVVFGCEPSQVSLLYFLYVSSSANGVNKLLDTTEGSAQEFRIKETAAELPKRLAEFIGIKNVHLNSPVCLVDQKNDDFVEVKTYSGQIWRCKYVIIAVPPQMITNITFFPPLPNSKQQLINRLPMGHLIKFIATYKSCFWKSNSQSGESTVVVDNYKGFEKTFCCTFDATTHKDNPAIVGFIGGQNATHWSSKKMKERQKAVISQLVELFGSKASSELIHYQDLDWSTEKYVGGCPVGVGQPGAFSYFHDDLKKPFIRTYWAGTETSTKWTGYMEGAVNAGKRSALQVDFVMKSKNKVLKNSNDILNEPKYTRKPKPLKKKFNLLKVAATSAVFVTFTIFTYRRLWPQNFSNKLINIEHDVTNLLINIQTKLPHLISFK